MTILRQVFCVTNMEIVNFQELNYNLTKSISIVHYATCSQAMSLVPEESVNHLDVHDVPFYSYFFWKPWCCVLSSLYLDMMLMHILCPETKDINKKFCLQCEEYYFP